MISFDEAQDIVLSSIREMAVERVHLQECLGRIAGEKIISTFHIPHHDIARCDGYALKYDDLNGLNRNDKYVFRVVGSIFAGSNKRMPPLGKGEAFKVMTGAILPKEVDTIIKQENTERKGDEVIILKAEPRGANVIKRGSEIRKGAAIVRRGEEIGPITIGIIASVGKQYLSVFQRPRVSILATGDELIELGERMGKGMIYPSNLYSLKTLILSDGAIPVVMGIARDDLAEIRKKLDICSETDMICTTGGVFEGERDLVRDALEEMGWKRAFWKVKMRPGYPLAFGWIKGRPIFCIPGSPGALRVVYEEFVGPAIRKMMGREDIMKKKVEAKLDQRLSRSPYMRHFIDALASLKDGELRVAPLSMEDGGSFMAMKRANALIIYPEGREEIEAGEMVLIHML